MLRWIRNARLDTRTGIVIIALALIVWGVVTWVRVRDMVPAELTRPVETPPP